MDATPEYWAVEVRSGSTTLLCAETDVPADMLATAADWTRRWPGCVSVIGLRWTDKPGMFQRVAGPIDARSLPVLYGAPPEGRVLNDGTIIRAPGQRPTPQGYATIYSRQPRAE